MRRDEIVGAPGDLLAIFLGYFALFLLLGAGFLGGCTGEASRADEARDVGPSDAGGGAPDADSGRADALDIGEAEDAEERPDAAPDASPDTREDAEGAGEDAGQEPAPPPQKEVFFNIPSAAGDEDLLLEETIKELLAKAPPGSDVLASYYTWTRVDVAEAFADAADRGVHVQIIVGNTNVDEGCSDWSAIATLKERLGAQNLTVCRECEESGGCIGDGINHNKFILFSALEDGSRDVVVQSSANLTKVQRKLFNNMVVIRDDPELYQGYKNYWLDLRAQQPDLGYYSTATGSTGTKAYFFPRDKGDTIFNILGNIDCSGGGDIRVAMAYFTPGRVNVAEQLAAKAQQGCQVQVLIGALDGSDTATAAQAVRQGGAEALVYTQTNGVSIHSKYLLIDANYLDAHHRVVWTGSHNYTQPALRRHDETLLKIEDDAVYEAYLQNWTMMRERLQEL